MKTSTLSIFSINEQTQVPIRTTACGAFINSYLARFILIKQSQCHSALVIRRFVLPTVFRTLLLTIWKVLFQMENSLSQTLSKAQFCKAFRSSVVIISRLNGDSMSNLSAHDGRHSFKRHSSTAKF